MSLMESEQLSKAGKAFLWIFFIYVFFNHTVNGCAGHYGGKSPSELSEFWTGAPGAVLNSVDDFRRRTGVAYSSMVNYCPAAVKSGCQVVIKWSTVAMGLS